MMEQTTQSPGVLLEVESIRKYFPVKEGLLKRHVGDVRAVDDVSFSVRRGETLGLVGESGCGKTTLGRVIAGAYRPTRGSVRLHTDGGPTLDASRLKGAAFLDYLRQVQMIFQDPYSSLNPRRTVMQIIEEPLICLTNLERSGRTDRVLELLEVVGLDHRHAERYPHAFSGGQRQRIGVARALAINPSLLVCDEAVSALDVSVRGQIINLLIELRQRLGLAYLFISHDLSVVKHISDRIAVMYVGKLVEVASSEALFTTPVHPYTEALLSAVPRPDPDRPIDDSGLEGDVADPANRPSGCAFHPRCPHAQEVCREQEPPLIQLGGAGAARLAACHFAGQLPVRGIFAERILRPGRRAGTQPTATLQPQRVPHTDGTAHLSRSRRPIDAWT